MRNVGTLFMILAKEQVSRTMTTKAMYLGLIKHLFNECQMLFDYLLQARCWARQHGEDKDEQEIFSRIFQANKDA